MHPEPTSQDAYVPLRARDGTVRAWAVIDAADKAFVNQWRWHLHDGYAVRNVHRGGGRANARFWLHRVLLGLEPGDPRQGDHENLDRLDNHRVNLRVATNAQNCQNQGARGGTSAHRGVSFDKRRRAWEAYVNLNGRKHHVGYFADQDDAGRAASEWRAEHMPYSAADHASA